MDRQTPGSDAEHTTIQEKTAQSEPTSPVAETIPMQEKKAFFHLLSGEEADCSVLFPIPQYPASLRHTGARNGPSAPQDYQKATRLLARLPRWRKARRRLFMAGMIASPIAGFFLWRAIAGPDWWQCLTGLEVVCMILVCAYGCLWQGLCSKYNRATSVVLKASEEQAVGPIIDACCQLPGFISQFKEIKRTLTQRLEGVTSPEDVALTDTQIVVLHEIVQGKHLPVSFDAYSRYTILHALVHIGDVRSVACMKELTAEPGKTRIRAEAEQCLVRLEARLTSESQRASLLRAGTQPSQPEATLLRPATPTVHTTDPAQLLRPHSEA